MDETVTTMKLKVSLPFYGSAEGERDWLLHMRCPLPRHIAHNLNMGLMATYILVRRGGYHESGLTGAELGRIAAFTMDFA